VKYRIAMSVEVDARDDNQAHDFAVKLKGLLSSPLVRMAVEGEGVRLSRGDGKPVVHQPQRQIY